ncbi:MAG: CPBP family intramembrane metalloprotease [Oscillospiraceae bacterium]|jgi:membrane protease YdiL (CAAX protease family)|nr:CPBP family intramembrane metalloprotease [Oscillospiraceae bacterium]
MEKQALRSLSRKAGCALLAVCALQLAMSAAAVLLRGRLGLGGGPWFHLLAVLSGATVLAGALLGARLLGGRDRGGPAPPLTGSFLLVPAGAALCMAGNLVGALVERIAGQAGIEFQGGPQPAAPQGLPGLLLLLLTAAALPAVAEEWLLRGVILPALRRFGDGFAVVCAAALFALLHQNMEQAPMAFVSGLALGWAYVRSGRLAVPVAIHLWNNAAAVALTLLPGRAVAAYALGLGALGALSLFALCLRRAGRPAPEKITCELPAGRRALHFFFGSGAMVLALAYFVALIAMNTRATGGS